MKVPIPRTLLRITAAALLLVAAGAAHAQRAWLDRDRIELGETATLNIQADGVARPDYTPLIRDFELSGRSSSSQASIVGGATRVQTLHAVALRPRRAGLLSVPALSLGGGLRTQSLALQVDAPRAQAAGSANDDVFIVSEPDDADPYVQQAVGWVVRLYSAVPLINGHLVQPAPEGATMQQVGSDVSYARDINGRTFRVIERRFQLIPERSGALTVPGPSFDGRGTGGLFDELFGGRGASINAQAPARVLQVRPAPANAPQPWLPLRDLRMRYIGTPTELRVGNAGALTIEVVADGASAAQMPELQLPPIDGVQVFAEPVQADETFRDGRPQVKLTRRFSLVPSRTGKVTMSGLQVPWWDVVAGQARRASVPAMSWTVAPGGSGAPAPAGGLGNLAGADVQNGSPASVGEAGTGATRAWALAALAFAALWLVTLVWALHRRAATPVPSRRAAGERRLPEALPSAQSPELQRALDTGDLGDVADVLRAMLAPAAPDLDTVRERLADPAQRQAVDALQKARWGGGDGVAARQMLRTAFARGPRWHTSRSPAPSPLPPLYPTH